MMTTILLCVLLLLGIVWLTLGIAYSYERWRDLSRQRIGQRQEPQQYEVGALRAEEAHELVAKSRGLTAHVIPSLSRVFCGRRIEDECAYFCGANR